MSMRRPIPIACFALPMLLLAPNQALAAAPEECFERLDNGVDMTGWRKGVGNPHGPGDGWTVEDGAFVGRQTAGQQGGILVTETSYQDAEVILEVRIDWGCDSGLFFRTTDDARAYQVTVDHVDDSSVGTLWGESFSQTLRAIPYLLADAGNSAVLAPDRTEEPIFDLALWPTIWDPTAFNEIRARIEGNPPHVQAWISGTQVLDFTDTMLRSEVNASGPLAIQVHNGGRWVQDGTVAFRNIRVRDLGVPCEDPGSGGTGGAGSGGSDMGGSGGAGAGGQAGGGAGGIGGVAGGMAGSAGSGGTAIGGAMSIGGGGQGGGGQGVGASAGTMMTAGGSAGVSTAGAGPMATPGSDDAGCACRTWPARDSGSVAAPVLLGLALLGRRRFGRLR